MLDKLDQAALEAFMLSGQEFTFRDACLTFAASQTQEMQIDRTIQKLRRKKQIKMRREGRTLIWGLASL